MTNSQGRRVPTKDAIAAFRTTTERGNRKSANFGLQTTSEEKARNLAGHSDFSDSSHYAALTLITEP
jgi:hypothetical protein